MHRIQFPTASAIINSVQRCRIDELKIHKDSVVPTASVKPGLLRFVACVGQAGGPIKSHESVDDVFMVGTGARKKIGPDVRNISLQCVNTFNHLAAFTEMKLRDVRSG